MQTQDCAKPPPRTSRPYNVATIRYRPGEAIRWLETGAEDIRRGAQRKGKSLVRREGERTIGKDLKDAAGVLVDYGKSALTDLMHRQAGATEFALHDERFEVISPGRIRSIKYHDVKAIKQRGDRVTVVLDQGSVTVKPHAYIVSGRIKVPIGWSRGGLEVPYEVFIDELAARCQVEVEYLS